MEHRGTITIETKRLRLRKFRPDDALPAFQNWESDERVTAFLRWSPCKTPEETSRILDDWIASYCKPDFYQWAIVCKDGPDEPVGSISAVRIDERIGMVEIGYCIGVNWWNQGIMTEVLGAVIPFFFEQVKANRICAQHDPNNPGSGKVMAKCGLRYEGTLRQADYNNRGIVDAAVYGILAEEYRLEKTSR
ncbi:MAG: GNAT family protein [Oscillospiraceae bacterium]|nr:GNAT family protein [Oscillospiraceae bacterium]